MIRQNAVRFAFPRKVGMGLGPEEVSMRNRTRATLKALPALRPPPSPLRVGRRHIPAVFGPASTKVIRQNAVRFAFPRKVGMGLGPQEVSMRNRTRATLKALPALRPPPSPLRMGRV